MIKLHSALKFQNLVEKLIWLLFHSIFSWKILKVSTSFILLSVQCGHGEGKNKRCDVAFFISTLLHFLSSSKKEKKNEVAKINNSFGAVHKGRHLFFEEMPKHQNETISSRESKSSYFYLT